MSAAKDQADCRRFERWLTAYVDDELDAVHILDVETHLEICEWCLEEVELARATRCSLRRMVQMRAPSALRSRICSELRRESCSDHAQSADSSSSTSSEEPRPELIKARYAVPLAVAAMFALVFGALQFDKGKTTANADGVNSAGIPMSPAGLNPASFEMFLDDLVAQHAKAPPFEVTQPDETQRFEPVLGFNTKPPTFKDSKFAGMRLHSQRAAMMGYHTKDKHRFTLYMFDAKRLPIVSKRLRPEHHGAQRVYVGRMSGYTIAARDSDGVGMAIASDLDEPKASALLMATNR